MLPFSNQDAIERFCSPAVLSAKCVLANGNHGAQGRGIEPATYRHVAIIVERQKRWRQYGHNKTLFHSPHPMMSDYLALREAMRVYGFDNSVAATETLTALLEQFTAVLHVLLLDGVNRQAVKYAGIAPSTYQLLHSTIARATAYREAELAIARDLGLIPSINP